MISGNEFIHLAGKLCVSRDADEATFRSAVSRAYYGAFHLSKVFLEDLGFPVPVNESAHGFLRLLLMGSGHPSAVSAGSLLRDLHQNRIRADYDLSDDRFGSADLARLNVERAHRFRTLLDQCRSETDRREIQDRIAE